MPCEVVLFDSNVYDRLSTDPDARDMVEKLVAAKAVRIVATPIVVRELRVSPFGGIPGWFPVHVEPEGIAISGIARSGMARAGVGKVYRQHLGESRNGFDAIIAQSAYSFGAILVTEDRRARQRFATISGASRSMSYDQCRVWIGELLEQVRRSRGLQQP